MNIKHFISFYQKYGKTLLITVNGDSMTPSLRKEDKIYIRFDRRKPHIGDIVLFWAKGEYILHRIVNLLPNGLYITKGDANFILDDTLIKEEHIVGFADVNRKSPLFVSWAARLSYLQGKVFCHAQRKNNKMWKKLVLIVCVNFQHGYQWILNRAEIPSILSCIEDNNDISQI